MDTEGALLAEATVAARARTMVREGMVGRWCGGRELQIAKCNEANKRRRIE
jgi:hypothetical protein